MQVRNLPKRWRRRPSTTPARSQGAGYGQAHADAQVPQRVQRPQRPSQQGDYADLDYSGPRTTAPQHGSGGPATAGPIGIPAFGPASAQADQPHDEAEESSRPSSPS